MPVRPIPSTVSIPSLVYLPICLPTAAFVFNGYPLFPGGVRGYPLKTKAAVGRQIGKYTSDGIETVDGIGRTGIHIDRLPDGVLIPETGAGQTLTDDHALWFLQD